MSRGQESQMDLVAEQAVLGSMLLAPTVIGDVMDKVGSEDFYTLAHAALFEWLRRRYLNQEPIDVVSVAAALADTPGRQGGSALAAMGGVAYLHTLVASVPTVANVGYYAAIVARKAVARRVVKVGVRITQLGQAPEGDPDELIGKVIAEAESLRGVTNAHAIRIRQAVAESLDLINSGDTPVGSSTGFLELDDLMGLPRPGELIIVAGRPGSGKTVFATDWACTVASEGIRTMYVTLEMSAKEITLRMLSALSRVPHAKLRDSTLDTRDWDDLNAAAIRLGDYNLDVWDQARVGIADLRSELLRFASEDRPQMLVVDYIQLAEVSQKLNNRQEQVADLSRGLKLLAKELAMVVIAVAQLNRGPEGRTDKRPQLSDLRESGQLEADADKVILVHRPDMYDPHDRVGEADLIVAKCRNGRTGTVAVAAQLHIMRFADMALPR